MRHTLTLDKKKYVFIFVWAMAVTTASAQSKHLDPHGDTTFWYRLKVQDAARIGLADLTGSTDSLHFRYWMENQAVEVWTNDFVHFECSVFNLFDRAHVLQIPSGKKITGWEEGLDGEEFLLESATGTTYSFKAYWTPHAQHGVPQADTLVALNQRLRQLLNLGSNWSSFLKTLPPGCYREGEMMMVCPGVKSTRKNGRR